MQPHRDRGAGILGRVQGDVAFLHARHEERGIGAEAEARALAGGGVLLEETLAHALGDDARVVHVQADARAGAFHGDRHRAALGLGLDRVLHDVGEHRIAEQLLRPGGRAARLAQDERHVLGGGLALQIRRHLVHDVGEVDGLRAELVVALLHSEEVERQVDHRENPVAGALDDREQLLVLARHLAALAQQARHGDHAVERRLEIVPRHALHLLAQPHALAQRLFLRAPLGDVGERGDEARGVALLVSHRDALRLHPDVRAVGALQAIVDVVVELAAALDDVAAEARLHPVAVLGMDQLEVIGPA